MEGRCNSTRALTALVGLATVFGMANAANAQKANSFGLDKSELGHMARTLDQAIEWGATFDLDHEAVANMAARGVEDAMMCVNNAVDCEQIGDGALFINASFFDSAEIMEFASTGALTEICTTFVFAGGSCAAAPADPSFNMLWTWDFFPVDAAGVPNGTSEATFDSEFPLANLTVENVFEGTIGAGFPVLNYKFTLGDGGFSVESGDCWAMQPKFLLDGCSAFWETSSNEDGSATGDGLSLQDALMDGYDACDYTANDLTLCLDVSTNQPPNCTSAVMTDAPSNDDCDGAGTFPLLCDATTSQCLLFATADTANDPALPCAIGEDDTFTGEPTAFYSFNPTGARALISMCRVTDGEGGGSGNAPFPNGEFKLALYEVGVDTCDLTQIACSDSSCSANKPVLCMNDLDPMQTYVLEVAGEDDFDGVAIEIDVTCDPMEIPPVPANDDCVNAEALVFNGSVPNTASVSANTLCASLDGVAGGCDGTANGNSPGVWYSAVGDGFTWSVTMCTIGGGEYDAQINVYCGDCSTGLTCLVGNDDSDNCAPQSEVTFCTEVGRDYLIFVHGFFDVGTFNLDVISDPDLTFEPCVNETPQDDICVTIDIECPMDADFTEADAQGLMEVCGDDINSGCGTDPNSGTAFIQDGMNPLALPFTACGLVNAENNLRDIDQYRFEVTERSVLTIDMIAEFPPEFFFFDSDDCANNVVTVNPAGTAGTNLVANIVVNAGVYLLSCTHDDFSGAPCGVTNDYVLSVSATPLGRCCIANELRGEAPMFSDCCITTEAVCTDLGGIFELGADCSPITYTASAPSTVAFSSVIGISNALVIDGGDDDGLIGDDAAQFIDLSGDDSDLIATGGGLGELPFKFFGELRDDVAVVSNGNLAFPNGGVVILDATPDPIPTAGSIGTLNDFAGGLWTDLDGSVTGVVNAALIGNAPFRSLVVEYNAIPNFNAPTTANTFQIVLFEGSNCVRYLYNDIEAPTDSGDPEAPDYVVGVENQDGSAGAALDNADVLALDTSGLSATEAIQIDFCPTAELTADEACSDGPCLGDCDGSGDVAFNDLVSMLFEFGNPTPDAACNADESGDGLVTFNDLVAALFLFGPCP